MPKVIRVIFARGMEPFANLALEAYLLEEVREDECILYLWQNRRTVVIGKNQNCWKECNAEALAQGGGFVARRLSGGGAVYHDEGNLNFTFLAQSAHYDLERQLEVVLRAVRKWGIRAEKNGRNDIVVDGRKFSGNAFYRSGKRMYHHGTILIRSDMEALSQYLNVSAEKLRTKGVPSVRSRVINLAELNSAVTAATMRDSMVKAFGEVYGGVPREILSEELDTARLNALKARFSAWEWIYGPRLAFTYAYERRFAWGDFQLQLKMDGGRILDAAVYSDAMDTEFVARIPEALRGCVFCAGQMQRRIAAIVQEDALQKELAEDIGQLLRQSSEAEEEANGNTV